MAVTTTNLGVITAYGDAVAAGYTGTKAEWQALMASYATVGQQAVDAKNAAVAAKNTAVSKATEATTAANTATTKANEASASAQSIEQSASQIAQNASDISELKEDLYSTVTKNMDSEHLATLTAHAGYYINTNINYGDTVSLEPLATSAATGWAIYNCKEGNQFTLTGKGGNGSRLWAFVDADNKLLLTSNANLIQVTPVTITAPSDGKLICNVTSLSDPLPTLTYTSKVSNVPYIGITTSKYNKGILDIYPSDLTGWYSGLNVSYDGGWDSSNIPTGDGFGSMTTYAHVIEKFDALMAMDTGYVTKSALGTASGTDGNGNAYMIYEYVFSPKRYANALNNRIVPKVLLQCCAHGFEKNACYGTYYFLYDLVNNWTQNSKLKALRQSVEFHVIPVLNPYGFDNDQYYNANGVNINRNYNVPNWTYYPPSSPSDSSGEEPFDQPETAIVKAWVEANTDALMLADVHTNGHYFSSGYNNANPLMPVTGIDDEYYNQLFGVFASQIKAQSLQLPEEFDSIDLPSGNTDASFWGRIQSEDINLGKGHANIWCSAYKSTLSFTLEVFNGLKVDSATIIDYMSADAKKISSEVIGNTICEIIKRYASFDVKT